MKQFVKERLAYSGVYTVERVARRIGKSRSEAKDWLVWLRRVYGDTFCSGRPV
jgi:hypothetical protein